MTSTTNHPPNSLHNTLSFPTTATLLFEDDLETPYRTDDWFAQHWCLLGEVDSITPWPMRLSLLLKDKDGYVSQVAFYDKSRGRSIINQVKPGRTMAFLYPENHRFMDGQIGIRVDDDAMGGEGGTGMKVKVFPFKLEALLKANDKVFEKERKGTTVVESCWRCEKTDAELLKCGRCLFARYCSRECQTADWATEHKGICKAIVEIKWFKEKTWDTPPGTPAQPHWFSF